ncbi:MAG: hypothetical protein GXZ11_01310 [Tissierellia bacterium]|nr:hypothetical protein [Tissierellia bacterium]
MGFRVKGSDSILQDLIAWVSASTDKITDFNIGSAIRNSGFHAFGFTRAGTKKATGTVTITYKNPLTLDTVIAKGTKFNTGHTRANVITFQSTENIKVLAGTEVIDIPVECMEPGEIGNVYAGEINKLEIGSPYVKHILNTQPFIDGRDRESEANRELRFREYVHTLQRATADSLAYGIKLVPGVAGVAIDDNYIGWVYAYVYDKDGNLPADLKTVVERQLIDYRGAGIEVSVRPVVKKLIDLNIEIIYKDGIDEEMYNDLVRRLVEVYINTRPVGSSLSMSNLVTVINDTYRDVIGHINVCENADVKTLKNEIIKAKEIRINGKLSSSIGV